MNADFKPTLTGQALPFAVWIAAVDLLCLEAWQVDAYAVGPQPWELWHADGWTPERAVMELSTPTTQPDIEDLIWMLNHPTVTIIHTFRRIMYDENASLIPPIAPDAVEIEIALRYLDIQEAVTYPLATRKQKIRALERLGIKVQPDQHPLTAWTLDMCRENGLPEERPSIPIGEAAQELCPKWIWWLA